MWEGETYVLMDNIKILCFKMYLKKMYIFYMQ